jgi:hypothetical protein
VDRTEFLNRLESLHVRVRDGETLTDDALEWYRQSRDRLLALAVEVQARSVISDHLPRRSIRMGTALPVRIEAGTWSVHTITCDIGAGGFAVLLENPPPVKGELQATLRPPRGQPVMSPAIVVDVSPVAGLFRASFRLLDRLGEVRSRMEDVLLDGILEHLVFWDDVLGRLEG